MAESIDELSLSGDENDGNNIDNDFEMECGAEEAAETTENEENEDDEGDNEYEVGTDDENCEDLENGSSEWLFGEENPDCYIDDVLTTPALALVGKDLSQVTRKVPNRCTIHIAR
jgi:hypothetical protein